MPRTNNSNNNNSITQRWKNKTVALNSDKSVIELLP